MLKLEVSTYMAKTKAFAHRTAGLGRRLGVRATGEIVESKRMAREAMVSLIHPPTTFMVTSVPYL